MKKPTWRPCRSGSPQKTFSFDSSRTSFETGTNSCVSFWSGPPSPNRKTPTQIAIQLSMIVEITSWAPTSALRSPAIPAQTAPASAPATIAATMCRKPGSPGSDEPTQTPMIEPTRYWPCPPMLNSPQRKANATARPVRTSGTVKISVCCRLSAASESKSFVFHGNQTCASVKGTRSWYDPTWKNQLKPAPSKIAL